MATFELLEQQGPTGGMHVTMLSIYGFPRRDRVPAREASNRPVGRRASAIDRIRTICAGEVGVFLPARRTRIRKAVTV